MKSTSFLKIGVILITIFINSAASNCQNNSAEEKIINYKPEEVKIYNCGPVLNCKSLNYAPTMYNDDNMLIFVSDRIGSKIGDDGRPSHDFWVAGIIDDTTYDEPFNMDAITDDSVIKSGYAGINSYLNEGAGCYSNRFHALFFTACNRPSGLGGCDIYCCFLKNGRFGFPINLGPNVNSKYFDSQPSISDVDGRLYFISTRPGTHSDGEPKFDNYDIWYCDYDTAKKIWLAAQSLRDINTGKQEASPFIAPDGVTLFFASTGYRPNYGDLDFYVTRYNPLIRKWSIPENLGKPINTEGNEQFLTMPASGDCFYFSGMRKDNASNNLNIYKAVLPRPLIIKK